MSGFIRRARAQLVTAFGLSVAIILASCSEQVLNPGIENYSAGTPRSAISANFSQYQFLGWVLDVGGANDTPAQSDINAFTRADNVSGTIAVKWVWDDVNSWTGSGQTGDACALFDTTPSTANKGKGMADFAVCVRISNPNGDPTVVAQLASPASPLLYSCGDSKADRCASSIRSLSTTGIVCEVEKQLGEDFFQAGDDSADVIAACSIPLSLLGGGAANLLNVCSFPSGSPNSNPFDCVVTPGAGFLMIKKATTPQNSGERFYFTISPAPAGGASHNLKDSTTGVEHTGLISAAPGTKAYSVGEGTLPTGWTLNAASCAFDRSGSPAIGTKIGSSIDSVSVESGETTICTFDNRVLAPSISVVKTATPGSIPETGGSVSYGVVVTNNATIPVTLASLVDSVFGNLNAQGTCNGSGNAYGIIAPSGTYSCSFSKTLSASDSGATHINKVTASVTSDGGPATASDTALVTYTDVLPDISVTKTVDSATITATGGTEVAGFTADAIFARGSSGSGGTTTPVFYGEICDTEGANDQPAQSDMDCFSRADNVTGYLTVRWTWDDINSWTGSGQTGDACALLDTDGNGSANYSFCARITNPGGDPTQIALVEGSPILYGCKDKANDRCSSPISVRNLEGTSTCTISLVAEHFAAGEDGHDTQAECKLKLSNLPGNLGIADVSLVNVCSFPSGSPNSNPFDCVVVPGAGFLVIVETTTPTNSNAYFAFTSSAAAVNGDDEFAVQGGATSAGIPINPGTLSLTQQRPTSWNLTSVECTRGGVTVASGTAATQTGIGILQGQTTICTFTNTLVGSRLVTFTVVVTNNSLEDVTLFSLEDAESTAATFPASPSYLTLNNVGTCVTGGTITGNGGTYSCTFTRTISGSPGTVHRDRVRAVGKDDELHPDTELSSILAVTIN
jgi:hypothetical protein